MRKREIGPTEIKILLLRAGITQAQIARQQNVSRALVHAVVMGQRRNPTIRLAVAQACGMPVKELWPDKAA